MPYTQLQWRDGTPYNAEFDDIYHSSRGSESQCWHVFLQGNDLPERFAALSSDSPRITVAETGFGTGLNFIVTAKAFLDHAGEDRYLDFISVDQELLHPDDLRALAASYPELVVAYEELLRSYPRPIAGIHRLSLFDGKVRLTMMIGDAVRMLSTLSAEVAVEAWYLDGFSPAINPAMWQPSLFEQVARLSAPGATLATYTIAGDVRRGLQRAGFEVSRRDGYANKRDMLVATLAQPPSVQELAPWFTPPSVARAGGEVAIIGAGIAGLMTARALVGRGYRVSLIDRHAAVAAGASGNPAALVMPRFSVDDEDERRFQLQCLLFAIRQYETLQSETDASIWHGDGVDSAMDIDRVTALFDDVRYAEVAAATERDDTEAGKRWLRYTCAGWLKPDRLCASLFEQLDDAVTLIEADIVSLTTADGRHRLYAADDELIAETGCVVLANAAGMRSIAGLPTFPVTRNLGQVTTVGVSGELPDLPVAAGAYCTPVYDDGVLTTGATYRHDLDQQEVLEADHRFNLDKLQSLQPGVTVDEARVHGRVSERANVPDRVPLVGAMPDVDWFENAYAGLHHGRRASLYPPARHLAGLYLNVAHGSRGFTTAPLCGEIIASMIDAAPVPVCRADLDRLNPARFVVRRLKKPPADTI